MNRQRLAAATAIIVLCLTAVVTAQFSQFGQFGQRGRSRSMYGSDGRVERNGVPDWKLDQNFAKDVFTFARIRYRSMGRWGWQTDYPDADLNFSYRLQ
ncbi:MAG: transmembrane prediction, partial [Planctomycetaceae bacterium]